MHCLWVNSDAAEPMGCQIPPEEQRFTPANILSKLDRKVELVQGHLLPRKNGIHGVPATLIVPRLIERQMEIILAPYFACGAPG